MDEFICVRLIRTENLDLSVFQFDPDLTFAVFFLNADSTIYGRYGSRSDLREAEREMSLEGLRKAMTAALELHKEYPKNAQALRAKTGPKPKFKMLTEYPWIKQRRRNAGGCMHCHHLQNAEQNLYRTRRLPIPEHVLFPWPMPDVVGLKMDPDGTVRRISSVEAVAGGSPGGLKEKPDSEGVPIARQDDKRLAEYLRFMARNKVAQATWRERNTAVFALLTRKTAGEERKSGLAQLKSARVVYGRGDKATAFDIVGKLLKQAVDRQTDPAKSTTE